MKKILPVLVCSFALMPCAAQAASKYLSSPGVKEGVTTLKSRGSVEWGDNDDVWRNKIDLEHGLTAHFKVGIAADIRKYEGETIDYTKTELKATYRFTGDESSLQAAAQGKYEFNHVGDADEMQAKLLLRGQAYGLDHKANLALSHEIGDESEDGVSVDAAWGSYYDMGTYDIGAEYYADFGNLSDDNDFSEQEHHIGPVIGFDIPLGQQIVGARLGYLVGLTDESADHVIKYELGTDF